MLSRGTPATPRKEVAEAAMSSQYAKRAFELPLNETAQNNADSAKKMSHARMSNAYASDGHLKPKTNGAQSIVETRECLLSVSTEK
jgi:hypothetical protein